jgi:hypothetical protein
MQHCLSWLVREVLLLDILRVKRYHYQVRIRDARWATIRRTMAREGYYQKPIHSIFLLTETVLLKAW